MEWRRLGKPGLAVSALKIRLTPDDLRRIDGIAPKGITAGDRYPDMSTVNR